MIIIRKDLAGWIAAIKGLRLRLKQEVKVLHTKALSSVRWATASFNSPDDDGRTTRVLLGFQHAFEMLLKAALVHSGKTVFEKKLGRSLGFEDCVKLAIGNVTVRLSPEEAGTVRAVDAPGRRCAKGRRATLVQSSQ